MASRVGLVSVVLFASSLAGTGAAARQPPTGTAMYVIRNDPRMCPSPLCGGYWVTIANGARTRCSDSLRHLSCYVGRAVDTKGRALAATPQEALVRGAIDIWPQPELGKLDQLVVSTVYAPAGTAAVSGGYYRVFDTGIRCVRAPCFSYRATQVNGRTGTTTSSVDLEASGATSSEITRARTALRTKDGLYSRGGFATTSDGGRVFRALRFYLRVPLPRA
jgi:hypothetical protein